MKTCSLVLTLILSAGVPFASTGCGKTNNKSNKKTESKNGDKDDHPTEGPHHGHLVELGDHEYHAEVVHGSHDEKKTDTVTIYILDTSAKKQVPIDAKEVVINLKHDGKPEQFKLPAVPDHDDPQGKSSRFQLKNKKLAHDLEAKGAEPNLTVRIAGKSYTGKIEHDHDHKGHKH